MPNKLHLLTAAIVFAACTESSADSAGATDAVRAVRIAPVAFDTVSPPVTGTGVLAARDELRLGFKIGGVIARVAVREGQTVARGQLLAALDLREIDAQVAKAGSAAAKAERDAARAMRLYRDSVATLAQMQDATTALEVARSDLATARFNRQYATIVAPSAGTVLRRLAEPGELIAPGAAVISLASATTGRVLRVGLTDRDVMRVRLGDRATVHFDAVPDRSFAGRVGEIAAAATPGTGTYVVEIALPGAASLATGFVGRAEIESGLGQRTALVPIESIVEADGENATVYALDSTRTRAHRIPVVVAFVSGDRVAVRGRLDAVTTVVTDGSAYLDDGLRVRVVP